MLNAATNRGVGLCQSPPDLHTDCCSTRGSGPQWVLKFDRWAGAEAEGRSACCPPQKESRSRQAQFSSLLASHFWSLPLTHLIPTYFRFHRPACLPTASRLCLLSPLQTSFFSVPSQLPPTVAGQCLHLGPPLLSS